MLLLAGYHLVVGTNQLGELPLQWAVIDAFETQYGYVEHVALLILYTDALAAIRYR